MILQEIIHWHLARSYVVVCSHLQCNQLQSRVQIIFRKWPELLTAVTLLCTKQRGE